MSSWMSARLLSIDRLSARVSRVVLRGPAELAWGPGQYLALKGLDAEDPVSYYSIASAPDPARPGTLELAVGPESTRFFAGESPARDLLISPPAGGVNEGRVRRASSLVLIGMGTGIAPLRCTIQWVRRKRLALRLTLVVGARSAEERLYAEEWLAQPELEYRPVLSRPDDTWEGRVGRVQNHLDGLPFSEALFYVCGSRPMADSVREELLRLGVPEGNLRSEGY